MSCVVCTIASYALRYLKGSILIGVSNLEGLRQEGWLGNRSNFTLKRAADSRRQLQE